MNEYLATEGEEIIGSFLDRDGIKYVEQKKIYNLKNDYFDYRIADFFIPKYNIYIEFLGKWRDKKANNKYEQKKEIYAKNNIPCVYIYPDNLGALKHVFYMRLEKELKKHPKLKFQLFKYRFTICSHNLHLIWGSFFILALTIILLTNILKGDLLIMPTGTLFISGIFLGAIIASLYTIKKIFKK